MSEISSMDVIFDDDDIQANRWWAAVANFAFFLPLIFVYHSKFVKFHANQGLLLWLQMVKLIISYLAISGIALYLESTVIAVSATALFGIAMLFYCGIGWIGVFHAVIGIAKPLPKIKQRIFIKY